MLAMPAPNGEQGKLIEEALSGCHRVEEVLRDTERDFGSMPFFVRPMVRRGFVRRTGGTMDEWRQMLAELARQLELSRREGTVRAEVLARYPALPARLESLAEHYRTAPERAARGMQDQAALHVVRERAASREQAVRALHRALGAMGELRSIRRAGTGA